MKYRSELKHLVSEGELMMLRSRLGAIMKRDPNVGQYGVYQIRSLYFDNYRDKALSEKMFGTEFREKFRIRAYNLDFSHIRLEKKIKNDCGTLKSSCPISREQTESLLSGDYAFLLASAEPLMNELYFKMHSELLRPKAVIDYTREPFVAAAGNVRITFDTDIRTALSSVDFLNPDLITVPIGAGVNVLEVKYDDFLPADIAAAVQLGTKSRVSFSKYAAGRLFG